MPAVSIRLEIGSKKGLSQSGGLPSYDGSVRSLAKTMLRLVGYAINGIMHPI
jgi:hypothetical protein